MAHARSRDACGEQGFYFGKLALMEMGVSHMVLYRFLFASIAFLPIVAAASCSIK